MAKSKYDPKTFPLLAQGHARKRLSDVQIAQKLGISISCYYNYQRLYPEFAAAIAEGKAPVDIEVENALFRRAIGYSYEEKYTKVTVNPDGETRIAEVRTTTKDVPPEVGAIVFWLTNRDPNNWKNRKDVKEEVELTLKDIFGEDEDEVEGA